MSTPDSFVDEVTDAVRRDKLFAAFRRYGWIGVLVVVGVVGGAAWNEWQKAQAAARAEAFGDSVTAALTQADAPARLKALGEVKVDGDQAALLALLQASNPTEDKAAALAALDGVIGNAALPQIYRDLATLKRVAVAGADQALADRRTALQAIAAPGRPLRVLAEEQLAYLLLEEGKKDEALAALTTLVQDQEAPAGMRQRLSLAITALGGKVPDPKPAATAAEPSAG